MRTAATNTSLLAAPHPEADVRSLSDDELLGLLDSATGANLFVLVEAIDRELVVFSPRQYRYVGSAAC